ncbi:MAG TPA: DUF4825 domain-containing protein [Patescibacteria group bacterium]|nr:DUF4825 domain-containing protein [Patescibacteria group bacterium]
MKKIRDLFKTRKGVLIIAALFCITLIASVVIYFSATDRTEADALGLPYNSEELLEYKTAYVGDNSKVVNLMRFLPYGEFLTSTTLQTKIAPYVITAEYNFESSAFDRSQLKAKLTNNAAVVFSLVQNVDVILLSADIGGEVTKFDFVRAEFEKEYGASVWDFSKDAETFEKFLETLVFKVGTFPKKYSLAMSSTPGIQLTTFYYGDADIDKVHYSTEGGILFTWDTSSGRISDGKQELELPYGLEAYWSPLSANTKELSKGEHIVMIALFDKNGKNLGKKQIVIASEDNFSYSVKPSLGIIIGMNKSEERARSMEEAISLAIMARRGAYRSGEIATEGHIILEVEENGPQIKVYTIASYGAFGFENGVFTKISGSGAIPTVITLGKSEEGHHALLDYKEPQDGAGYTNSIKKMFPSWLQQEALAAQHYYSNLAEQQEEQAADYLMSIGRNAEVSAAHVDKVLAKINVEASNKLFSELGKYDVFINTCPYWIGTIEQIENGVRYIYETSQEKTRDGYDIVIFRKKDIEGTVIKEAKYKIIGNEPQLME